MSYVLTGIFNQEEAETITNLAANSDILGYPASATFEEKDDKTKWRVDIYLLEEVEKNILDRELGSKAQNLEMSKLPDTIDWVKEGLKDLKPVQVARFFVHGDHDKQKVQAYHHAIQINANQAFGTGHHGTTAGCLEAIAWVTKRHHFTKILDLGTGSGILATALAKQTGQKILATDIDPISVKIARENMALNKVAPLVKCQTASGFHHPIFKEEGPFELIVANILAGPLRQLAKPMTEQLSDNATIILSGLLIRQKAAVLSAYREQGAYLRKAIHKDGWATLILNRP